MPTRNKEYPDSIALNKHTVRMNPSITLDFTKFNSVKSTNKDNASVKDICCNDNASLIPVCNFDGIILYQINTTPKYIAQYRKKFSWD